MARRSEISRRRALGMAARGTFASSVVAAGFPAIVPASVFGATAPSNRIGVGAIGTGRISRGHDMPGIWKFDQARIMAVCDLDSRRVEDAKVLVNGYYAKKTGQALRRCHGLPRLQGAAREQGRGRRRDLDAGPLARADRDRRGRGRQGRLPAEAGVAHHRRGPGAQQRRAPDGTHLPDRQPAALGAAVPLRGRARAQRAHRQAEDGLRGPARRSFGRPGAGDAGSEEPRLREVARLDAVGLLHREARSPAGGLRPPRLAALRAVRRRDDHRLGRPPHRQRPLGDGDRVHRPRRDLGHRRVPEERAVGRSRPVPDRGRLRGRRAHDRERRVPERHQVRGKRRLDLRLARQRHGHQQRPGREAEGRAGTRRQQPRDHHLGDRAGRDPPLREQGPARQLARLHPLAPAADRAGGGGPPLLLDVPAAPHRDEDRSASSPGIPSRSTFTTTTRQTRCCPGPSAGRMPSSGGTGGARPPESSVQRTPGS